MIEFVFAVIQDFFIAFIVGICWAILFGSPRRILYIAGLLGGMGHACRFILIQMDMGLITSTLLASVLIGLTGILVAHKVHNPPVVFTMPACITMIPGMFAYKTMLAGIKMTDAPAIDSNPLLLTDMVHNFMLTMSLLFALAIGICIGTLLFRKSSTKDIDFSKEIKRMIKL